MWNFQEFLVCFSEFLGFSRAYPNLRINFRSGYLIFMSGFLNKKVQPLEIAKSNYIFKLLHQFVLEKVKIIRKKKGECADYPLPKIY